MAPIYEGGLKQQAPGRGGELQPPKAQFQPTQLPEKGGNNNTHIKESNPLPEKDARKRASMLQATTSGKQLSDQDVAKVCACWLQRTVYRHRVRVQPKRERGGRLTNALHGLVPVQTHVSIFNIFSYLFPFLSFSFLCVCVLPL
jgi:hypothetical protein